MNSRTDACPGLREEAVRLMSEIGIPEGFAARVAEQLPAGGCRQADANGDGAGVLACRLAEAAESRARGAWKRIPEQIWLDTMRCFSRFISEYHRSYGRDGFDRGEWTVRQSGCRLFRIGELEYELAEEDGKRFISLHIPSDARLEAELLNDSVRRARDFLREYYPEWQALPIACESWLLSPKLADMLSPESRIMRFRQVFDILQADTEDESAIEWVFYVAEGQRASIKPEALPENTSLQRRMKERLLKGEKPGNARGILVRAFR